VKEARPEETPAGKMVIQLITTEFKDFNGIKLPVKQVYDVVQAKFNINFSDIKVNQGLSLDDLK
jgi:hypothetical protein